jgi:hypothetical protein
MLIIFLLVVSMSGAGAIETKAQHDGFGVGIMVGEPTGLSFKYWLSPSSALDGGAAWSFYDQASMHLHADYLWHKFDLIPVKKGELPLYFGVGSRLKIHEKSEFGIRFPVGIAYVFAEGLLDTFAEVVPIMDLFPATEFGMNGAIGIRFYFK